MTIRPAQGFPEQPEEPPLNSSEPGKLVYQVQGSSFWTVSKNYLKIRHRSLKTARAIRARSKEMPILVAICFMRSLRGLPVIISAV
jgi:hypothetical protein